MTGAQRGTIVLALVAVTGLALARLPGWRVGADERVVGQLMQRADTGDETAILELGRCGDASVMTFLRKFRTNPDGIFGSASTNAQMALAKLGDQGSLDAIFRDLRSDDPPIQSDGIRMLAYVGGPRAIRALGALLSDPTSYRSSREYDPSATGPGGELPIDREVYPPLRFEAVSALAQVVSNPPTGADVPVGEEERYVELWRRWWTAHRSGYE